MCEPRNRDNGASDLWTLTLNKTVLKNTQKLMNFWFDISVTGIFHRPQALLSVVKGKSGTGLTQFQKKE